MTGIPDLRRIEPIYLTPLILKLSIQSAKASL
jgi:hypothetical protein